MSVNGESLAGAASARRHALDDVDAALLRELQRDGRASVQALADAVDLSRTAVRARLQHLLGGGVVRVVGILHSAVTGREVCAHVSVAVEGRAERIAAQVATREAAAYVTRIAGRYALIAELRVSNDELLLAELDWLRSLDGVRRVDVVRGAETVKDAYSVVRDLDRIELDEVDWWILGELQRDGRVSYTDLAERIGRSHAATRTRVMRLVESGTVHVTGLVDSSALGVREQAGFGVRVSRDVRGSAERIAEVPGVHYVLTGVGRFDVIGGADATSRAGLLEVLEATRAVATVRELEAWYHLEIVKESYAVDLPGMALPSSS